MKRHAAFPHFENIQRVGEIIGKFVKQYIAQAPAQNHADHAPSEEIVEHFFGKHRVARCNAAAAEPDKQHKADNIAERIPADGQGADAEQYRVKLRVYHHDVWP